MVLQTTTGKKLALEPLTCLEAVKKIAQISRELAGVLENLPHLKKYTFYSATYRFGDAIVANGKCYLPLADGGVININHQDLPAQIKRDLQYDAATADPLLMFLNRYSELYSLNQDMISSHSMVHPGQMLGIPRAVRRMNDEIPNSALFWNLNAGSRTLFMLTPISDKRMHSKLQEYFKMKLDAPNTTKEHWQTFVEIAKRADCEWRCEVIYFPRQLINHIHDRESMELIVELNHIRHAAYNIWHNRAAHWDRALSNIEQRRGLINYSACALTTAKHLFMIGADSAIGFRPVANEDSAPVNLLQNAYADIYGLTHHHHSAIIMEPARFDLQHNSQPVYYSINYSIFRQLELETPKRRSNIVLLDEISAVQRVIIEEVIEHHAEVKSLYQVAKYVQFKYYHLQVENYPYLSDVNHITQQDSRFNAEQQQTFPVHSPFFKGCIGIAAKTLIVRQ